MRKFRYAPSPTGRIHLGQLKAILIPYILSKKYHGEFILRIEDTDQKRNKKEAIKWLLEDLKWLGIKYDKGPKGIEPDEYFQSQRLEIYNKYIDLLLKNKQAYLAFETPEERLEQIKKQRLSGNPPVYSGDHANLTQEEIDNFLTQGKKPVVRLKVPKNEIIKFKDEIYGEVSVNTNQIGDFVIRKSDGTPMYNFSVVIDDHEMGITDVIRGFGHLSNTPKQILLYKSLGWEIPTFAHFSDILNEDGHGKLSKRAGAKSIHQFRAEGYVPEALINYVFSISCSFTFQNKEDEIMNLEKIINYIDYNKLLKTNAKFNSKKLDWFNGIYIRMFTEEDYLKRVVEWLENYAIDLNEYYSYEKYVKLTKLFLENKEILKQGLLLVKERITKFMDIFDYIGFFFQRPNLDKIDITATNHNKEEFKIAIKNLFDAIRNIPIPWEHNIWEMTIRKLADELNWKHADLFMALRIAITGSRYSPPLFESMMILGREECLERIKNSILK